MRALLCSSLTDGTGNRVTAERVLTLLEHAGFCAALVNSNEYDSETFASLVASTEAELVVAVHAYRSGRLLLKLPEQCIAVVVLGDPDDASTSPGQVNKAGIVRLALQRSKAVVAFTSDMLAGYETFRSCDSSTSYAAPTCIPQAVLPPPPPPSPAGAREEEVASKLDLRQVLGLAEEVPLLLLVAGLRPVKQPLYLLPALQHCRAVPSLTTLCLCIVGPVLEEETARQVAAASGAACLQSERRQGHLYGGREGLFYHPPVPRAVLYSWLAQADACVNSSSSEGQSNTLLEAAMAGCPRIATAVPGNMSIIQHGVDGLLYSSVEEASACILAVVGSPGGLQGEVGKGSIGRYRTSAAQALARGARERLDREHGLEREARAWRELLHRVTGQVSGVREEHEAGQGT